VREALGRTLIRADLWRGAERVPSTVVVEDGTIVEVAFGRALHDPGARQYEIPGGTLYPGLIDLHVHGGGGADAAGPEGDLALMGRWLASRGVTGFLASIPALPWEDLCGAVRRGAAACAGGSVPNLLGLHLEGPFLSPVRAGSQPREGLCSPDLPSYRGLRALAGVHLRMMTLAPELPGARDIIAACRLDGVVAAVGHTDATYEQTMEAFAAGARHVTHLFNAMRPFHHRDPGPSGAALTGGDVTAEIILDGHHVHRAAYQVALRALGRERLALVSDALPVVGAPAAQVPWAGRRIARAGSRVALESGGLAGGGCPLNEAVARAVAYGTPAPDAAFTACRVAAGVLGLDERKGRVLPGFDADLVAVDDGWRPLLTLVGGRQAWPQVRRNRPA